MKVSIIIPMYNCQDYIEKTLESIKLQTYKDYELILIDDGSVDKTKEIALSWQEKNSEVNIVLISQTNHGVSFSRNLGIKHSTGDYLLFCDADDLLSPDFISLLLTQVERNNVDVSFCMFTHSERVFSGISTVDKITKCPIDNLYNQFLFDNSKFTFCGFLYRRSIIGKYGIQFSLDLKYGEDEEFTWKYLCHCHNSIMIDAPLYFYRENPTSATKNTVYQRTQVINSMVMVAEYYEKYNNLFFISIEKYGKARAKLAILREFSLAGRTDLYWQLVGSSIYSTRMVNLLLFPDFKVRLAALLFIVSPFLFFKAISKFKL